MDPFYKQDIFFFVTTVAVIVIGVLLAVLIAYLIRISRDVKHITDKARTETDLIAEDIDDLRQNVRREGMRVKHFSKFFQNLKGKSKK